MICVMTKAATAGKEELRARSADDRAHRHAPVHGRDELVAGLMVEAFTSRGPGSRQAALVTSSSESVLTRRYYDALAELAGRGITRATATET